MAYDRQRLIKESLEAIEENNLVFIDDIMPYIHCSSSTFYNHELEKVEEIKDALFKNKIEIKKGLRDKWYKNDNASTQIALYKLIGTKEDRDKLNNVSSDKETLSPEDVKDGFQKIADAIKESDTNTTKILP